MNWKKVVERLEMAAIDMQNHARELEKPNSYGRYNMEDSKARAAACYSAGMMIYSLAEAIKEGAK